jgi:hypothetical protein
MAEFNVNMEMAEDSQELENFAMRQKRGAVGTGGY